MIKKWLGTAAAAALLLTLTACHFGADPSSSDTSKGGQTDPIGTTAAPPAEGHIINGVYTSPDGRFSLGLPDSWSVTDADGPYIFQASNKDGLVLVEDPSDSIGNYTSDSIAGSLAEDYAQFQRLDGGELTIGGRQALFCQYQYVSDGVTLVSSLYLIDGGASLFSLTYTVHDRSMDTAVRDSALSFALKS